MSKDLYEVLGVTKGATQDEIKKAFRKRARDLHPDVCKEKDAEDKFKELNQAYDVLSDPQKRSQYDRFGSIPSGAGGGYQTVDFNDIFGGSGFDMGDLFSSFWGGKSSSKPQNQNGRDMAIGVSVDLCTAASGVGKEIVYDRLVGCKDCECKGSVGEAQYESCTNCGGSGKVSTVQNTIFGQVRQEHLCGTCKGRGENLKNPCGTCGGDGRVQDRQTLTVQVPAGVKNGQKLRVEGYGEAGLHGLRSGDLLVTINVIPHAHFERDGDNLHVIANISILQATLGAQVEIEGVLENEIIQVSIPQGCQNEQVVRVKDAGMPRFKSKHRGDMLVHVTTVVPKKLTKKEREMFEALASEMGEDFSPTRSRLEKLRDVFS